MKIVSAIYKIKRKKNIMENRGYNLKDCFVNNYGDVMLQLKDSPENIFVGKLEHFPCFEQKAIMSSDASYYSQYKNDCNSCKNKVCKWLVSEIIA